MNGIDKITQRIADDARAEAQTILTRAEAQAKDILAAARTEADRAREETLARARQAAGEDAARAGSMARLEGRKRILAAKQDMIAAAFERALTELTRMPAEQQIQVLSDMAAQAAVTGAEQVLFSADDQKTIGPQVVAKANEKLHGGKLTLSDETRPITGGFILASGGVELNCAYETLVRLSRSQLEREAAHILFET